MQSGSIVVGAELVWRNAVVKPARVSFATTAHPRLQELSRGGQQAAAAVAGKRGTLNSATAHSGYGKRGWCLCAHCSTNVNTPRSTVDDFEPTDSETPQLDSVDEADETASNTSPLPPSTAASHASPASASTNTRSRWLRITVQNDGVGISATDQVHLFTPFVQIRPGALQQSGGSGLGLAITQRIVELHGGVVGVISEQNKKTLFFLEIPLLAGPAAAEATPNETGSTVGLLSTYTHPSPVMTPASSPTSPSASDAAGGGWSRCSTTSTGRVAGAVAAASVAVILSMRSQSHEQERVATAAQVNFNAVVVRDDAVAAAAGMVAAAATNATSPDQIRRAMRCLQRSSGGTASGSVDDDGVAIVVGAPGSAVALPTPILVIVPTPAAAATLAAVSVAMAVAKLLSPALPGAAAPVSVAVAKLLAPELDHAGGGERAFRVRQPTAAAAAAAGGTMEQQQQQQQLQHYQQTAPSVGVTTVQPRPSMIRLPDATPHAVKAIVAKPHHQAATLVFAMVIDDVMSNRMLLARLLQRRGVPRVLVLEGGHSAMAAWRRMDAGEKAALQCVFCDKEMPGDLDGHDTASNLRAEGFTGVIIGVTGNALEGDRAAFVAAGANMVVFKPVTSGLLEAALASVGLSLSVSLAHNASPAAGPSQSYGPA